jgi:hypothetical protein
MNRPIIVAALLAGLLGSGCANPQTFLRPGEDPQEVAATIDRRARGEDPPEPESLKEGRFRADYLTTGLLMLAPLLVSPLQCAGNMARCAH